MISKSQPDTEIHHFQINGTVRVKKSIKEGDDPIGFAINQIIQDIFFGKRKCADLDYNAQIFHINSGPHETVEEAELEANIKRCKDCNSPDIEITIDDKFTPNKTVERYTCNKCSHTGIISTYIGLNPK